MFFFKHNEIIMGLKKYPVLSHFSESALKRLIDESETITIHQNQTLFSCGEQAEYVFYLIEGHLNAYSSNHYTRTIGCFRSGELVGDVDVVAGEPRGLAVRATRESRLLKISKDIFMKYFQKNPDLFIALAESMARRLRKMILNTHESTYEYKNIGLIALSPDLPMGKIKRHCLAHIAQDNVRLYDQDDFKQSKEDPINFFHQCQSKSTLNLFFCVNSDDVWSQSVFDYVDYLYLFTWEGTWALLDTNIISRIRQRPCDLAILHHTAAPIKDTSKFYDKYPFKRHHHLMDTKGSHERLYRYMTGQAIGLVVSGGGLRGFAHYGLIKALFESKIPIDYIGGSSMGALTSAMIAIDYNWNSFDQMSMASIKKIKKTLFLKNLTLPFVSILSGKTMTDIIYNLFKDYQIEDLKTNYFCVVSNLSDNKKEIVTKGSLWKWIRASTAVPGIAPPFEKDGRIYVDGAVCSSLPIFDMRKLLDDVGSIIAFNLQTNPFQGKKYHFPPILTMKTMILYLLGIHKHDFKLPSIFDVLTEAPLINQNFSDNEAAKTAEIIIALDTSAYTIASKKSDALIQPAYELAQRKFNEYLALFKRWTNI